MRPICRHWLRCKGLCWDGPVHCHTSLVALAFGPMRPAVHRVRESGQHTFGAVVAHGPKACPWPRRWLVHFGSPKPQAHQPIFRKWLLAVVGLAGQLEWVVDSCMNWSGQLYESFYPFHFFCFGRLHAYMQTMACFANSSRSLLHFSSHFLIHHCPDIG